MFKENLSEEKTFKMAKDYLSVVSGEANAVNLLKDSNKVETPRYTRYDFFDNNQECQFVVFTDFDAVVSFAGKPVQDLITMLYRKEMYKSFGKDYLNALDSYTRKPIEEEYNRRMTEHNEMIEEIEGK